MPLAVLAQQVRRGPLNLVCIAALPDLRLIVTAGRRNMRIDLEAAAERGWIDREAAILETLTSIHRAGADVILTYWASEAARLLAI